MVLARTILLVNFILKLKLKHDNYNNNSIQLLITFLPGFKMFRIYMSRRK